MAEKNENIAEQVQTSPTPAAARKLSRESQTDADYSQWLRGELDNLTRRAYGRIFYPRGTRANYDFVFGPWAEQTRVFAVDMFNLIKEELFTLPWGSHYTLLDIGAGCGAGTALLASFFEKPYFGYTIACEAMESTAQWAELYRILYPDLRVRTDSPLDVADGSYDVVTVSHMVERIPRGEVAAHIRKLAAISRKFTIVTCPWREAPPLHPAHAFSVDDDLLDEVAPDSYSLFRSFGWNNPVADPRLLQSVAMVFRHKN
ncbi:MAG TPA: class I SAM-dependent methyltransferase [Stellaceae bacterium]|nr:class I SAM-dependent methyltransferase [Stellaceae bacterium]